MTSGKYEITSDVDPGVVDLLFDRIAGDRAAVVTRENVDQLRTLCDELGFSGFDPEFRTVLGCDLKAQKDLVCMRSRADRQDILLEQLQLRVAMLEGHQDPHKILQRMEFVERQLQNQHKILQRIEFVERQLQSQHEILQRIESIESQLQDQHEILQEIESVQRQLHELRHTNLDGAVASVKSQTTRLNKDIQWLKSELGQLKGTMAQCQTKTRSLAERKFVYSEGKELDGIIQHLTLVSGGNVHDKGVVEVTARTRTDMAKNVAELGTEYYQSKNRRDQWLCYDFKDWRVTPTSYSLRAFDCQYPVSWVIEVSKESSWEVIDRPIQSRDLTAPFQTANFSIPSRLTEGVRFIRIRQTEKNSEGFDELVLTAFEIFGTLTHT